MKKNITIRLDAKLIHEMKNYVALGYFRSTSQMVDEIIWSWIESAYDEDLPIRYPKKESVARH